MDRNDVRKWLAGAVADARITKNEGCWVYWLDRTTDKHWALVMAFNPNCVVDASEREYIGEQYIDGYGCQLCVKIAYQPWNSMLQCDYDIDWLMPFDSETGDVFDTEFGIREDASGNEGEYLDWLAEALEETWNELKGAGYVAD